ncbi:MAG TPA: PRC-barrel domain-containing protein [Roseiarcus sp.]|jgi:hypothetical protein
MRTIIMSVLAAGALAGAAFAQNAPTTDKSQPTPSATPNFITLDSGDMLSSNVVGLDVRNDQNNDIGKIQDVAFDSSKSVKGYILSVGGFLGIGTHYVAVQPESVMIRYDANAKTWRATMNATKDQLKAAPEFKYGGQWTASRT